MAGVMTQRLGLNPAAAAGPPALVTVGTSATAVNASSVTPSYPAGIAANDIAFLAVALGDNTAVPAALTVNTPSGWTFAFTSGRKIFPNYGLVHYLFWKRLTGSESGTVTVTTSAATGANAPLQATISAWRGAITTGAPFEQIASRNGGVNATMESVPFVTGLTNGLAINFCARGYGNSSSGSGTSPGSGWTEAYDVVDLGGFDMASSCSYRLYAAPGATDLETRTNGSTEPFNVISLMLMPPGSSYIGPSTPSTHTMWGMLVEDANEGFSSGHNYSQFLELDFFDASDANLTGTQSSKDAGLFTALSRLFDDNDGTEFNMITDALHPVSGAARPWAAMTFGSAAVIDKFSCCVNGSSGPKKATLAWSSDGGSTWNNVFTTTSANVTGTVKATITFKTPPNA